MPDEITEMPIETQLALANANATREMNIRKVFEDRYNKLNHETLNNELRIVELEAELEKLRAQPELEKA